MVLVRQMLSTLRDATGLTKVNWDPNLACETHTLPYFLKSMHECREGDGCPSEEWPEVKEHGWRTDHEEMARSFFMTQFQRWAQTQFDSVSEIQHAAAEVKRAQDVEKAKTEEKKKKAKAERDAAKEADARAKKEAAKVHYMLPILASLI
jgi:hypothetical protein